MKKILESFCAECVVLAMMEASVVLPHPGGP